MKTKLIDIDSLGAILNAKRYNKPRNLIAKDLRTPKYRMRTVDSKVAYERKPKHKESFDYEYE